MFDIKWIRENPDAFDDGLAKRGLDPASETIIELDKARREAQTHAQAVQEKRNKLSKQIGVAKSKGEDAEDLLKEVSASKKSQEAAENINRQFAEQVYNIWSDWVFWAIPHKDRVRGVKTPLNLPDGTPAAIRGIGAVGGISTAQLWVAPAATETASTRPCTDLATELEVVVPSPSWPSKFCPQHATLPVLSTAQP